MPLPAGALSCAALPEARSRFGLDRSQAGLCRWDEVAPNSRVGTPHTLALRVVRATCLERASVTRAAFKGRVAFSCASMSTPCMTAWREWLRSASRDALTCSSFFVGALGILIAHTHHGHEFALRKTSFFSIEVWRSPPASALCESCEVFQEYCRYVQTRSSSSVRRCCRLLPRVVLPIPSVLVGIVVQCMLMPTMDVVQRVVARH